MNDANPINITQIDHVVIRARNLSSMIEFYQEVLGCRLERGPGDNGLAQLRAGSSLIDLVDVESSLGRQGGGPPTGAAPNMDHVCLQIEPWDSDAILSFLKTRGVEADEPESRYGARGYGPSIYLSDPEGNRVELKGQT